MRKLTILTIAALTASTMASAAYAGSDLRMLQIGEENAAYFHPMGSGGSVAAKPDYQFIVRPEQRMAVSNAAYFAETGNKGGRIAPFNRYTDVSPYPFSGGVPSAEREGYVWSPAIKH